MPPFGLVDARVTVTTETYHPFVPAVPATCIVVTGAEPVEPLIRTTELFAPSALPALSVAK